MHIGRKARQRESLKIAFAGKNRVEVLRERIGRASRGQALVRARCSLISTGTERTCLERRFAPGSHWDRWVQYPFSPGYSSIGVVEEIGRGVTTLQPGQRVASHAPHAEYALVAETDATVVPDGVADEEAAWFTISCIVQLGFRRADVPTGSTAVVIGTGLLGQLALQYARAAGAAQVVVVGRSRFRLETALAHGATDAVAADARDSVAKVHELTNGGAALVIDVTGSPEVLQDALRMARPLGTVILLGDPGYPEEQRLTADLLRNGLVLIGAHFGNASLDEHAQMARRFFSSVQEGEVRVHDLVTDRVDPREAPAVYRGLLEHAATTIGVVFDWTRL